MGVLAYGFFGILLGSLAVTSFAASIQNSTADPLVTNWKNLPSDEKENFLSYFLALGVTSQSRMKTLSYKSKKGDMKEVVIPDSLGLTEEQVKVFQDMNIPESSVQKLLQWATSEFDLGDSEVMELAVERECCRGEYCIHILPDVNELCCPW